MATIVANSGAAGNFSAGTSWVGGSAPTAADDAQIGSGTTSITVDTGSVCRSLDCTGFAGTLTHTAAVTLTIGDGTAGLSNIALKLGTGTIWSLGNVATSAISFVSTSTTQQTITTTGKPLGNLTINGAGSSYIFQDAINIGATATLTLTAGTLNLNNQPISVGLFSSSNSNTRVITMGASTLTCSGVGTIFTLATSTGLTLNKGTSTILLSDVSGSAKTFAGGGNIFNILSISGGGAGAVTITGANTFSRVIISGGTKSIVLPGSTTTTINYTKDLGNGTNIITFTASAGTATVATVTAKFLSWDYVNLTAIASTGTTSFYAGANSTDGTGNTGWAFYASSPELVEAPTGFKLPPGTFSSNVNLWVDGGGGTWADRVSKTAYTPAALHVGALIHDGKEIKFDGVTSILTCDDRSVSNTVKVNSVTFWANPSTTAAYFIDLNGTASVGMTANAITIAGWTSPTVYVNGVATSTVTSSVWSLITVTSATGINASAVVLGKIGASFYSGSLTNMIVLNKPFTATDHGWMYARSK